LDERGIPAARGGKWSAVQVARLIDASDPSTVYHQPFAPLCSGFYRDQIRDQISDPKGKAPAQLGA
jgi:hypothetical protein